MSKRSHSQISPGKEGRPPKRQAAEMADEDAFGLLRVHAKDLIQGFHALQSTSSCPASLLKLQSLSTLVLPALAHLAGNDSSSEANDQINKKVLDGSHISTTDVGHLRPICPAIPTPTTLAPFTAEEIPSKLPPLPEIRDPALEIAAFTHSGISGQFAPNYERLEWLGDAYSEVISSSLLYRTFENLPAGRLSQLRELLIKNANLGQLGKQYGLVQRAKLPKEILESKEKMKKVPGDIMEAYIAAVILADPSQGLQRISEWLRAVFSMTIKDQIKALSKTQSRGSGGDSHGQQAQGAPRAADELPKVQLQKLVGVPGVKLRYEDDPAGPKNDKYNKKLKVFSVNLYMDGWGETNKWLGRGTDLSKKDAGQKAAQMALGNASLIKKYTEKKAAFQAAQQAG